MTNNSPQWAMSTIIEIWMTMQPTCPRSLNTTRKIIHHIKPCQQLLPYKWRCNLLVAGHQTRLDCANGQSKEQTATDQIRSCLQLPTVKMTSKQEEHSSSTNSSTRPIPQLMDDSSTNLSTNRPLNWQPTTTVSSYIATIFIPHSEIAISLMPPSLIILGLLHSSLNPRDYRPLCFIFCTTTLSAASTGSWMPHYSTKL